MPMNIDDDRFWPVTTEGNHPWRSRDLEDDPVHNVEGIGGHVNVMAYAENSGLTYEQAEPVGESFHRVRNRPDTVRPS